MPVEHLKYRFVRFDRRDQQFSIGVIRISREVKSGCFATALIVSSEKTDQGNATRFHQVTEYIAAGIVDVRVNPVSCQIPGLEGGAHPNVAAHLSHPNGFSLQSPGAAP